MARIRSAGRWPTGRPAAGDRSDSDRAAPPVCPGWLDWPPEGGAAQKGGGAEGRDGLPAAGDADGEAAAVPTAAPACDPYFADWAD